MNVRVNRWLAVLSVIFLAEGVLGSLSTVSESSRTKVDEEAAKARLLREPTSSYDPSTPLPAADKQRELDRDGDGEPLHHRVSVAGPRGQSTKIRLYGIEEVGDYANTSDDLRPCPGLFCGRMPIFADEYSNATITESDFSRMSAGYLRWSDCGACPRGYRADERSECVACGGQPSFYDWMYLLFTAVLAVTGHWITIDVCAEPTGTKPTLTTNAVILHIASLFEVSLAAVLTLLAHEPLGSLNLRSCPVEGLPDWYTLFFNPKINFSKTIYCTQEAVYPLYTMVFVFYVFALLIMLLFRPIILKVKNIPAVQGRNSIYIAMYILPVLTFSHAAIGGLLYFSFPYILIVIALIANAIHFGFKLNQNLKSLVLESIKHVRNVVILLCQWALLAFGIVSLTQMTKPVIHYPLLGLIPVPALFYVITAQFTDPNKLHLD